MGEGRGNDFVLVDRKLLHRVLLEKDLTWQARLIYMVAHDFIADRTPGPLEGLLHLGGLPIPDEQFAGLCGFRKKAYISEQCPELFRKQLFHKKTVNGLVFWGVTDFHHEQERVRRRLQGRTPKASGGKLVDNSTNGVDNSSNRGDNSVENGGGENSPDARRKIASRSDPRDPPLRANSTLAAQGVTDEVSETFPASVPRARAIVSIDQRSTTSGESVQAPRRGRAWPPGTPPNETPNEEPPGETTDPASASSVHAEIEARTANSDVTGLLTSWQTGRLVASPEQVGDIIRRKLNERNESNEEPLGGVPGGQARPRRETVEGFVEEIVRIAGDPHSRNYYRQIVGQILAQPSGASELYAKLQFVRNRLTYATDAPPIQNKRRWMNKVITTLARGAANQ